MKRASSVAGQVVASGRGAWLLACLLTLLGWGAWPRAGAADTPLVHAQPAQVVAASPPAAAPLRKAGLIDYVLGNRSRMIQIATLALLLGLFILMRK